MVTARALACRLPLAVVLVGGIALANTINVPADYPTIQAAIDAAVAGDVVVVAPGKYVERIDFKGKAITVQSSSGSSVTTIDGSFGGSVVRFATAESRSSILQGFTITRGTGTLVNFSELGGGIYCEGASPTILDNDVVSNRADDFGGGIYLGNSGALVQGNTIRSNSSWFGTGGGINSEGATGLEITANVIEDNTGIMGAGVAITGSQAATLADNQILSNRASTYGGGLYADVGLVARGNLIQDNVADGLGGGIYGFASGGSSFERNTIRGNRAVTDFGSLGGGVCSDLQITLVDNLIVDNEASGAKDDSGGGVALSGASSVLTNNTIVNNRATKGGGIQSLGSNDVVTNCIVWGNSGTPIDDPNGSVVVTWSDVEGGFGGTGNVDVDPLFVDPSNGDFHLTSASPCIDAGSNSAPDLPAIDIDGDPRVFGATVDLGSDEYHGAPIVRSITPGRTSHDQPVSVQITGHLFTAGSNPQVFLGGVPASNVVVVDDQEITCDAAAADPGLVDVVVSNDLGAGTLPQGFIYTPATQIVGTPKIGNAVTIRYHVDPGDGIFAIYGVPPVQSVPTPPFDGTLCIVPFQVLVWFPAWPLDQLDLHVDVPNDPGLSGVQVLLQALIGPSLTQRPRKGAWTNCATLTIE